MKTKFLASAALIASAAVGMSQAAPSFWIYNPQLVIPTGFQSVAIGGAATDPAAPANTITRLLADDLNAIPGYSAQNVYQVRFMVVNTSLAPISARARLRFWNADGAVAGPTGVLDPGTYYSTPGAIGYSFNAFAFAANQATLLTGTLGAGFLAPSNTMWMGMTFDNGSGASGATADDLNILGLGLSNPVVGSSTDTMFLTTANGSFFAPANPAGAQFQFTGTNPPAANGVFSLGVQGKYFSATISLQDTDGAMALQRDINYVVKAGSDVVTSGVLNFDAVTTPTLSTVAHGSPFAVTPNTHFLLPAVGPNGATDLTIELDGGPYLKRRVALTLPAPAPVATSPVIDLGTITLQNGDVDGSGEVDAADIDQVIADFGNTWPGGAGSQNSDVDNSGEVDAADIDIVIANFGGTDD